MHVIGFICNCAYVCHTREYRQHTLQLQVLDLGARYKSQGYLLPPNQVQLPKVVNSVCGMLVIEVASVAQWLEHWSCKPGVESSSLSRGW